MSEEFIFSAPAAVAEDLTVYNVRQAPFSLHGLYKPYDTGLFKRLPDDVALALEEPIASLYTNTPGARVRFTTDSDVIAVGAVYAKTNFTSPLSAVMSGLGAYTFDLYADGAHVRALCPENIYTEDCVSRFAFPERRYEAIAPLAGKKMREITLFFPNFVNVSDVFIGLRKGSCVKEASPYRNQKPVVFYGSSITHGACASRSGNAYPNLLSRRLGIDILNLGFAAGCRAEKTIIDYLCTLDPSVLVFDYDHNAPDLSYLERTHLPALRALRAAHPYIPFLLLSKPNIHTGREQARLRRELIERSAEALRAESDAPVYFIDGGEIYESFDSEMMTIDNTHPTDLGFFAMACAVEKVLKNCF